MEAFRRAALALPLAALFVLVLCISPATAKRGSTKAAAASQNLVVNGNFALGLHGWRGKRARLRIVGRSRHGRAVRVIARRHRPAAILHAPRPVPSTMARQLYSAAAWVRGRPARRRVCLRL